MQILYTGDNEGPAIMSLDDLIDNFLASDVRIYPDDIRVELAGRGWYEGVHDNGRFLILNIGKLELTPTPEGWDGIYSRAKVTA